MIAVVEIPSVNAGINNDLKDSYPEVGSHFRLTENSSINRIPNQKRGIHCPTSAIVRITASVLVFRLIADITPAGIPSINEIKSAVLARIIVAGNRSNTTSIAGSL
jgi:hypothetical protein